MTAASLTTQIPPIVYPSADGEPVAETYDRLYAILTTLEVLKQYLSGRQATVLANQFLYYSQGRDIACEETVTNQLPIVVANP